MDAQTADLQAVVERLEKVEKQKRWVKAWLVGVTAAWGGAFLTVVVMTLKLYAVPEVIEAKEFRVVDQAGRIRGSLTVAGDTVTLDLDDRISLLSHPDEGTVLTVRDAHGAIRVALGLLYEDESPKISLLDDNSRSRLTLRLAKTGMAAIVFKDEKGEPIWRTPMFLD